MKNCTELTKLVNEKYLEYHKNNPLTPEQKDEINKWLEAKCKEYLDRMDTNIADMAIGIGEFDMDYAIGLNVRRYLEFLGWWVSRSYQGKISVSMNPNYIKD